MVIKIFKVLDPEQHLADNDGGSVVTFVQKTKWQQFGNCFCGRKSLERHDIHQNDIV
jgi:hypothetical protein